MSFSQNSQQSVGPHYHLAYFNGTGLGEIIRLLFSATNTPFEDFRYPISFPPGAAPVKPEFDVIKHTLPFGQIPVLTVTKGGKVFTLAQSKAIERYVAKQTGLFGNSDEEAALIDSIGELVSDLKTKYNAVKADHVELTKFLHEVLPLQLSFVEKFIDVYGSGYAIGNSVSLADIQLYNLLKLSIPTEHKVIEIVSHKIASLLALVASIPGIKKWEDGRPARNELF